MKVINLNPKLRLFHVFFLVFFTAFVLTGNAYGIGHSGIAAFQFEDETDIALWQSDVTYFWDYKIGMLFGPNRLNHIDVAYGSTDIYVLLYSYALSESAPLPANITLNLLPETAEDLVWSSIAIDAAEDNTYYGDVTFPDQEIHETTGFFSSGAYFIFKPEEGYVWTDSFRSEAIFLEQTGGSVNVATKAPLNFIVEPTPVPIPSSLLLFVTGILGLRTFKKKK